MATVNKNYQKLKKNYLFSDISQRVIMFKQHHPSTRVFSLGIGNTTEPLPRTIIDSMKTEVEKLGKKETYSGYGDEQGNKKLREDLVDWYKKRGVKLTANEFFISDGAKPDTANIQSIFALDNIVAVQDPVYPVYVDSNIISGRNTIIYLPATEKNNFFPSPPQQHVDIIYICSPNNPTGAVATKKQLEEFVGYAKKHKAIIIFDGAYAGFIQDENLPHSIYEINGAYECAIEINSFSKLAGFTGVRLGWTIIPQTLMIEGSSKGQLHAMWLRRQTTMFNGASNIAQFGGMAVLSKNGQKDCGKIIDYYMGNARIIIESLKKLGFTVSGGIHAPYVWMKTPQGLSSWDFFDLLLQRAHVVVTPGVGFGSRGEGYVRLSAFGKRQDIIEALESIERNMHI